MNFSDEMLIKTAAEQAVTNEKLSHIEAKINAVIVSLKGQKFLNEIEDIWYRTRK